MDTQGERLRWARERKEFRSAAAFARRLNIPEVTYRAHEKNRRKLSETAARQYAESLGVRWDWLITGEGDPEISAKEARNNGTAPTLPKQSLRPVTADMLPLNEVADFRGLPKDVPGVKK